MNVDHPQQWPNSAQLVPAGTRTTITIKPTYSTTSANVLELPENVRQCMNQVRDGQVCVHTINYTQQYKKKHATKNHHY